MKKPYSNSNLLNDHHIHHHDDGYDDQHGVHQQVGDAGRKARSKIDQRGNDTHPPPVTLLDNF
ncbi:MAG: hypothetical protein LBS09_08655 [Bacteroidales bacterium]|nr:hypothetical protein [Bacteroidales bacterium]